MNAIAVLHYYSILSSFYRGVLADTAKNETEQPVLGDEPNTRTAMRIKLHLCMLWFRCVHVYSRGKADVLYVQANEFTAVRSLVLVQMYIALKNFKKLRISYCRGDHACNNNYIDERPPPTPTMVHPCTCTSDTAQHRSST